ncbi:hypothetical protein CONLIGDRAFT_698949 [Coniochaeta ligniaria NRRL 30616]|uniref:Transcription factor domain-containing protein n=1 Tax=Coniochaeta ligniaria NRRL 30616 TaxID=1408157 RepID=A0A1J7IXT6_9PEZI|nr:hypothetical protein CONLIGDRAFT_698949 [Coniochaeta ligniaria NRRL 30616]
MASITRACSASSPLSSRSKSRLYAGPGFAASTTGDMAITMSDVEAKLLDHYLTHTCHIISFDEQDHLPLHVGIPELAMRCRPLMDSVLALAAACECCDIIDGATGNVKTLGVEQTDRILELLTFSERRHGDSLRGVQSLISDPDSRASVLANAALITIYGSASHQIRLWLFKATRRCRSDPLPYIYRPYLVQWIYLFKSVYLACNGLQDTVYGPDTPTSTILSHSSQVEPLPIIVQPSTITSHSLFEVMVTTWDHALESLSARAELVLTAEPSSHAHTCSQALRALDSLAAQLFSVNDPLPFMTMRKDSVSPLDVSPLAQISRVPSWLHMYLARATCQAPSIPLRRTRTVMAFVNRVPADYLTLVETSLNYINAPELDDVGSSKSQSTSSYQLAMDILAHWLVFVMLLDGLWWIGETGPWELELVISVVRTKDWGADLIEEEGEWWPEEMLMIRDTRQRMSSGTRNWDLD